MKRSSLEAILWPRPQQVRYDDGWLAFEPPLALKTEGDARWVGEVASQVARLVNEAAGRRVVGSGRGKHSLIVAGGRDAELEKDAVRRAEGYTLRIQPDGIRLLGSDAAGAFRGGETLAQIVAACRGSELLPCLRIRDWPQARIRGVHLYLPPREQFDFFCRYLDFLARYKFNTIYIEVGGGMEYERHPEIGEGWRRFCREARAFPGGPCALQASQPFWKDSTHTELAGGDVLKKEEVRKLVREARRRHFDVVPEVQSLSHAYYLCVPHREIAERPEDPYPDTYCPSNPESYRLLFDVMEEVIEVFEPKIIHIGHDEVYSIRVCPRCRRKTAAQLFAEDVRRIHDFLAERGIRTMMWGDKFLNITTPEGRRYGGVIRVRRDPRTGRRIVMPPTYRAVDMVPKDILICDWYYKLAPDTEDYFAAHGFEEIFGNFSAIGGFDDIPEAQANLRYECRGHKPNVLGAEISSWCEVSPDAFGHNSVLHRNYYGADILWNGRPLPKREALLRTAFSMPREIDFLADRPRILPNARKIGWSNIDLSGCAVPLPAEIEAALPLKSPVIVRPGEVAIELVRDGKAAVLLNNAKPRSEPIPIEARVKGLLLLHATTMEGYSRPTYYSYERPPQVIATYRVTYADGKRAEIEVVYAHHVCKLGLDWGDDLSTFCYKAYPVIVGPKSVIYAQEWLNPRPKTLVKELHISLAKDVPKGEFLLLGAASLR